MAVQTDDEDGSVLWIYDLSGDSAIRRLTFEESNTSPLWTPDGEWIAFASDRNGMIGIYWKRADGSGPAERLTTVEGSGNYRPDTWSPDRRTLVFTSDSESAYELRTLSIDSRSEPKPLAVGGGERFYAALSPDGKWLAYTRYARPFQVFVEPFPPTGATYRITRDGGFRPVWSSDGKRLFFQRGDRLMAVDVTTAREFRFSEARLLRIHWLSRRAVVPELRSDPGRREVLDGIPRLRGGNR